MKRLSPPGPERKPLMKKRMKRWLHRLADWLVAHRKNPTVKLIAGAIYGTILAYRNIRERFVREVTVSIDYVHSGNGKRPYTVRGNVVYRGKERVFSGIPWEKVGDIIELLNEADEPLTLEVDHGTWFQEIHLNRWARKEMANKLQHLVREEEKRQRMELLRKGA